MFKIVLFSVSSIAWLIWLFLSFNIKHTEIEKDSIRSKLFPLKSRIKLINDKVIEFKFQVYYDELYYIGLQFDDRILEDTLVKNIGASSITNTGFNIYGILYSGIDSITSFSSQNCNGAFGSTIKFGEFRAFVDKDYRIQINVINIPDFVKNDSAYLEIGVSSAVVSVGREFAFGITEILYDKGRPIIFWIAIVLSLLSLISFYLERIYFKRDAEG